MMINPSGVVVTVRAQDVASALRRNLRFATSRDMAWIESDDQTFRLPAVDGIEEHVLGGQIVTVHGGGASKNDRIKGAYSIGCNPRGDTDPTHGVIALDEKYWAEMTPGWATEAERFAPRNIKTHSWSVHRFTKPIAKFEGRGLKDDGMTKIQVDGACRNAHFTGISGMLLGKHLTTGPVVLTGFELAGVDEAGASYSERQLRAWEMASKVLKGVYVHESMAGPLGEFFPRWKFPADSDEWVVLGGGPSGSRVVHEYDFSGMNVVTCNAGLRLMGNPEAYIVTDPHAIDDYKDDYKRAQSHGVAVGSRSGRMGFDFPVDYDPLDVDYHGCATGILW